MSNLNVDDLYYKVEALEPLITDLREELVTKRYEAEAINLNAMSPEANILDAVEEFLEHYEEMSHPYNWITDGEWVSSDSFWSQLMSANKFDEPAQTTGDVAAFTTQSMSDFLNEIAAKAKTEYSKGRIFKMRLRLKEFEEALNKGMNPVSASEQVLILSSELIDLDTAIKKESSKWQMLQRGLLGK